MLNFITRYFSSAWAFLTSPFRAIWRGIVQMFPERDFTIMDTPDGNVYSFHQSSFWRFTKFCGTITLIIWAAWSTYVFTYHRPLLQHRTQQLAETREEHARQLGDISTYMKKYNELARDMNVGDDKILNAKKLSDKERVNLITHRTNIWGEMDFLQSRIADMIVGADYTPEFRNISEMTVEYDLIRAENYELKQQNTDYSDAMTQISDADNQIVNTVLKMTADNTAELQKHIKRINGTIAKLNLNEKILVDKANAFNNQIVGSAFVPLNINANLDPKYQNLADKLELWHGLARLSTIMPLGAPVSNPRITSNYGTRNDPFTGDPKAHKGIDFAGRIGTELYAVAPGRVISAGERSGYGKTVEVDHGLGFSTLYAHLSKINVARGDWVRSGTIVGLGGNTGRSTGPHLHYEIRYNGNPFNPANFIKE